MTPNTKPRAVAVSRLPIEPEDAPGVFIPKLLSKLRGKKGEKGDG